MLESHAWRPRVSLLAHTHTLPARITYFHSSKYLNDFCLSLLCMNGRGPEEEAASVLPADCVLQCIKINKQRE